MQDTVMYDLNRHLAEEAREEARDERLEEIAYSIRAEIEDALFRLPGADRLTADEAIKANARHEAKAAALAGDIAGFIDNDQMNEALVALYRGQKEAKDMLSVAFDDALEAYIKAAAEAELRRLEEIDDEYRALAKAGV